MKSRVVLFSFLFVSCMVCDINSAFADGVLTKVASTNYVDTRVTKSDDGAIEIKNSANKTVTVQNDSAASGLDNSSRVVTTVGWTDRNRTSKVKSVENNTTTLVDMWIE